MIKMKNYFNYKELSNGGLGLLKSHQLKNRNIDTIILQQPLYWNDEEYRYNELNDIKNIIIDDKKFKTDKDNSINIVIQNTRAENIYFKDQDNLGGLTIPIEYLKQDICLKWFKDSTCNLKEINIIFQNKIENIQLDEGTYEIELFVRNYLENNKSFILNINDKNNHIKYFGDSISGITEKTHEKYTYSNDDVKDGILDLTNISKKSRLINFLNLDADTVVIKKEDLFARKFQYELDGKLNVNKLKIIDENEMKLNPEIEVELDGLLDIYDIFITTCERNKFIYLDINNEIKVIDREKLLEDKNIEDIEFIENKECELILIKYKNNNYKVIDSDYEYLIDELFNDFLYLNINSYDFYDKEKPLLKNYINNNEWDKPFKDEIIDNNILGIIYDDYLKFIERIRKLKELGFKDEAIKYLIIKKYDNFVNVKSKNLLDLKEISKDEIDLFNNLSKAFTLKKVPYKILKK